MKKFLMTLFFLIVFLGGAFIYLRFILPSQIADNAINQTADYPLIPDVIKREVVKSQKVIETGAEQLRHEALSQNISLADLLATIDQLNSNEIIRTIRALDKAELTSTQQIYDIANTHMHTKPVPFSKFRPLVMQYITVEKVKRKAAELNGNTTLMVMAIPLMKASLRSTLEKKYSAQEF